MPTDCIAALEAPTLRRKPVALIPAVAGNWTLTKPATGKLIVSPQDPPLSREEMKVNSHFHPLRCARIAPGIERRGSVFPAHPIARLVDIWTSRGEIHPRWPTQTDCA